MRTTIAGGVVSALLASIAPAFGGDLEFCNDGENYNVIVNFVTEVTTEGSASYLLPKDRIAVFDSDGTLWIEEEHAVRAFGRADMSCWVGFLGWLEWQSAGVACLKSIRAPPIKLDY